MNTDQGHFNQPKEKKQPKREGRDDALTKRSGVTGKEKNYGLVVQKFTAHFFCTFRGEEKKNATGL